MSTRTRQQAGIRCIIDVVADDVHPPREWVRTYPAAPRAGDNLELGDEVWRVEVSQWVDPEAKPLEHGAVLYLRVVQ